MTILLAEGLNDITRMVLGSLAVAGAFLIGYVAAMLFLGIGMRLLTRKIVPLKFNKLLRIVAGLAAAAIVAMFVFGEGGMGYGAGSGGLPGSGKGEPGPKSTAPATTTDKETLPTDKKQANDSDIKPERRVRVTMLGGLAVSEKRFYQFEDQPGGLTLEEIEARVLERRDSPGLPLSQIEIFVYRDSPDSGSRVVRDLHEWSITQGLKVVFPAVQDRMRPER